MQTSFLSYLGPKLYIFRGFKYQFFQNYWIATQLLQAIESLTFPIENYPRKPKWLGSSGQNLGQIRPNVIKAKKLPTIAS